MSLIALFKADKILQINEYFCTRGVSMGLKILKHYSATLVNHTELLLSGCTTNADHSYLKVNDMQHDTPIRAAQEMGIRFCLARGSITI